TALQHTAIILLRIGHQARVLFGIKELILGHGTIAAQIVLSMPPKIPELSYDLFFAGCIETKPSGVAVALRILSKVIKAGIAISGSSCRRRVRLLKITEDGVH